MNNMQTVVAMEQRTTDRTRTEVTTLGDYSKYLHVDELVMQALRYYADQETRNRRCCA